MRAVHVLAAGLIVAVMSGCISEIAPAVDKEESRALLLPVAQPPSPIMIWHWPWQPEKKRWPPEPTLDAEPPVGHLPRPQNQPSLGEAVVAGVFDLLAGGAPSSDAQVDSTLAQSYSLLDFIELLVGAPESTASKKR